jgi:hypothetical protein
LRASADKPELKAVASTNLDVSGEVALAGSLVHQNRWTLKLLG